MGLACGGEIEIYIEKLEMNRALYKEVMALKKDQRSICLITDLISDDKILIRTDDPESLEKLPPGLRDAISEVIHVESSTILQVDDKTYFIHVFHPDPQLIIIGAVHISGPLARIATMIANCQ